MLVLVIAGIATLSSLRTLAVTILANPEDRRLQIYVDSTTGLLMIATLIASALLIAGLLHLRSSLLVAFQWFRRSVLVSLLVAQPLAFYEQQWTALSVWPSIWCCSRRSNSGSRGNRRQLPQRLLQV